MSLRDQLRPYVDPLIRERGSRYFQSRAVVIDEGGDLLVRAQVRGSQLYAVELALEGEAVHAWCACPYAERGALCKHIWAVVLAADARGYLRRAANARPVLRLRSSGVPRPHPHAAATGLEDDDDLVDEELRRPDGGFAIEGLAGDEGGSLDEEAASAALEAEWEQAARELRRQARASAPPVRLPGDRPPRRGPVPPKWRRALARVPTADDLFAPVAPPPGRAREVVYIVDAGLTAAAGAIVVEIAWRDRKVSGAWSVPKTRTFVGEQLSGALSPEDEPVMRLLCGLSHHLSYGGGHRTDMRSMLLAQSNHVHVPGPLVPAIMPAVCATGRCRLRSPSGVLGDAPLLWDDGQPWTLWLDVDRLDTGPAYRMDYSIRRGEERLSPSEVVVATADGHLLTATHLARFDHREAFGWMPLFHASGAIDVPQADIQALLTEIVARPGTPNLSLPPELGFEQVKPEPVPRLVVRPAGRTLARNDETLVGDVVFAYGDVDVPWNRNALRVFLPERRTILTRDGEAERRALADVTAAGLRPAIDPETGQPRWTVQAGRLPDVVRTLSARGWTIEAVGRIYRQALGTRTAVRSGIDWFDLEGGVDFGDGISASIADVVAAMSRGEQTVTLGDGSIGILPEDWLARQGRWTTLGEREGDALRFTRSQAALLDALLAGVPGVDMDAQFARVRRELAAFDGIPAADPPPEFQGELRTYQREGLGWIRFLERFGLGGCLADDMGLGKTVQVLAALVNRRRDDPGRRPSLVVVPRSLVFNWLREARRFAPGLRLMDHTGAGRTRNLADFDGVDVVITTYGTLRREAAQLAEIGFDYVVLDEAHAIKNFGSLTAKAVRLLKGRHRLALTGTPIQNHVGELWSLFEFLNPGLLGRSSAFARVLDRASLDDEGRRILSRVVRPFVLRRTKADVARDLPARLEDTVVCRLGREERTFYDGLRAHYRERLSARIEQDGWGRARILVLEALLRLRQAACHPGLVDAGWPHPSSAKLDVLVSHLREIREGGHKALVFSQFVTLLDRVRAILDRDEVPYEYLDGSTTDREARVTRFQEDPACPLFLISLKAGGLGLNLTAAEYVFLLDPWWNPAVEAQAIDRAHRIGQTQQVFAYRLIAENTIEEKVLELQARKRELAEAILGEDAGAMAALTREDLELLLS